MDIFDIFSLLGGLAMFLYGMRLMGDSLKENSSGALKRAMGKVTDNLVKAFFLGVFVTALIQSSTATIVITSGLVGAGILTLHQSLGIIIGANVGTTVTGQIIRLLDVDASGGTAWLRFLQPSTLAPIALVLGMVLLMSSRMKKAKSVGNIAIGFGILFSGLLNMTGSVDALKESGLVEELFSGLGENPLLGYVTGAGVAFVLQSSSATIGILQAFSATGLLSFKAIYAVIVGVYLGDCVTTAIVCSIGAKPDAKRVGIINILFNLCKTTLVLVVVTVIHQLGLLDGLWDKTVNSGVIANTNTIFNLSCAVCLFPALSIYEKLSRRIISDGTTAAAAEDKSPDKLAVLNTVFFKTPALALQSCYDILLSMLKTSRANIGSAFNLLTSYDESNRMNIMRREEEIDRMTDGVSHYMVELLPHLKNEHYAGILNQYYKVTAEFERLGDHAVNIAELAANLAKSGTAFSERACRELDVLEDLVEKILDLSEQTFTYRDVSAAEEIEPLVRVAEELISQLRKNHLKRMSSGRCSLMADAAFSNLMVECKRITDVCSNVGIATVVRVHPELADHEHLYFERLSSSGDHAFTQTFDKAHEEYFGRLMETT